MATNTAASDSDEDWHLRQFQLVKNNGPKVMLQTLKRLTVKHHTGKTLDDVITENQSTLKRSGGMTPKQKAGLFPSSRTKDPDHDITLCTWLARNLYEKEIFNECMIINHPWDERPKLTPDDPNKPKQPSPPNIAQAISLLKYNRNQIVHCSTEALVQEMPFPERWEELSLAIQALSDNPKETAQELETKKTAPLSKKEVERLQEEMRTMKDDLRETSEQHHAESMSEFGDIKQQNAEMFALLQQMKDLQTKPKEAKAARLKPAEPHAAQAEEAEEEDERIPLTKLFKLLQEESEKTGGMSRVMDLLSQQLNAWKQAEVNVAVVGASGAGKSTLINTLRNLIAKDQGGAKVGVKETTTEMTPYSFPNNVKIKLWDIPGVGTLKWPRDTYMEKIKADQYDFFLIIAATRFTDNDIFLAEKVEGMEKNFAYVRTKVDLDIRNAEDEESEQTPEELRSEIKQDIETNIKELNQNKDMNRRIKPKDVFVISSRQAHKEKHDFPTLLEFMVFSVQGIAHEAVLMSIGANTNKIIDQKATMLRGRVLTVVTDAAFSGTQLLHRVGTTASTNPGQPLHVMMSHIRDQIQEYTQVFGLDTASLEKMAANFKVQRETLQQAMTCHFQVGMSDDELVQQLDALGWRDNKWFHWAVHDKESHMIMFNNITEGTLQATDAALCTIIPALAQDAKSLLTVLAHK